MPDESPQAAVAAANEKQTIAAVRMVGCIMAFSLLFLLPYRKRNAMRKLRRIAATHAPHSLRIALKQDILCALSHIRPRISRVALNRLPEIAKV
jgi:hypothetical protein